MSPGKVFFIVLLFFLFVSLVEANDQKAYNWRVMSVVDSQTLRVDARPEFALPIQVQIKGIESPAFGKWGRCDAEKRLAQEAKNFLENISNELHFIGFDWSLSRPGTIVADIFVDKVLLGSSLINRGLAVSLGRNHDWCQ